MKTRAEIVAWVSAEIASAHDVHEHIELAYRLGYVQGQNDKETEMEAEPTDEQMAEFASVVDGKPALSRFLPIRPDAIPAPPEGWVYIGMGVPKNVSLKSVELCELQPNGNWSHDLIRGYHYQSHYAIRWSAPEEVWHRFGLLSPDEGGGWIPNEPGDPVPCDGNAIVEILLRDGFTPKPWPASKNCWADIGGAQAEIIGWRPALAEVGQ